MPATRSRLGVIFLTVLIDLIGFGIVMPILPVFAQRFGAQGIGYGALVFVFSAMQFLATALLGRVSDRIGRRPILLTTMLFNAAGYVLFAFAPSYAALFVARVISGFASGNISAAQAYVADITSPAERARGMGTIGAAFGIGFVLGPMIGGLADHYLGHLAPGLIAAGLSLVNFVSASAILPESLAAQHRTVRPVFDFGHMGEALARPELRPLMLVWLIAPFSFAGYTVALPLHATKALGWGARWRGCGCARPEGSRCRGRPDRLAVCFRCRHIFFPPARAVHARLQDRRNPQRGRRRPRRERQDLAGRRPRVRGRHEQTPWVRERRHRPHRLHPRRNRAQVLH